MGRSRPLLPAVRQLTGLVHPTRNLTSRNTSAVRSKRHNSTHPTPSSSASPPDPLFASPVRQSESTQLKPFFVTTPIFYVNASPHIGHLHSLLLTDALARFSRLRHPERQVIFSTGTDEHGLKIQQAAKADGKEEEEFCAGVSQRFRDLAELANISYTDFIRTSEPRHHAAVEEFWSKLVASDDIYKGTHLGWYSVSDECFYSSSQVQERTDGVWVATDTGNEVSQEEEDNWKFRLPKYRDRLLEWINGKNTIYPPTMRQYISAQIKTCEDLSISRPKSRVRWGVSVPGDPDQTVYVWVDALINYITVLGYPQSLHGWPVDVHVVGKDIIRFHALHWPALLMAAGLEPPRRVLAHAHWTMQRNKMSKSKGNVVDPVEAMKEYGVDGVRWYLLRAGGSLADDSDYSDKQLRSNYTNFASQIGNLIGRISSARMRGKIFEFSESMRDPELDKPLCELRDLVERRMERYDVVRACQAILNVIAATNRMFTETEPWGQTDATKAIVYAYTALRLSGILLQPIIPVKAAELLDRLGVPADRRRWEDASWPTDVDAGKVRTGLDEGAGKSKGHLFPLVQVWTGDLDRLRAIEKVKR